MDSDGLIISNMTLKDLQQVVAWARKEGWNPGLQDAECFYQADTNGFFKGEVNGELVAAGSAVIYDEDFAFCGLYIVAPEHRGRGYGLALTQARLAYCGDRNVGIDGVLDNVGIYQNIRETHREVPMTITVTRQSYEPCIGSVDDVHGVNVTGFGSCSCPAGCVAGCHQYSTDSERGGQTFSYFVKRYACDPTTFTHLCKFMPRRPSKK